ncbi:polyphenol oxidase family protein [Helicobacter sp. MIT 21-1697]|uniref:polyphenol oxidase family protein n=1 Tax=Helicobacter sp. MIT 21-1697 TaxID=2993733 RepID=UPI00224B5709|nr:polyphenol oxidase family protein [Helicobacter sp. MIT 21-1697]MCX2717310.1 polyphenol oxidase family protein [Helicobacter sp. MIT 21-1697]
MFLYTSLQSHIFKDKSVYFALSNRLGGVSEGIFDALNLSYYVGDERLNVERNHHILLSEFWKRGTFTLKDKQKTMPTLYYCNQIHSTQSIILDEKILSSLDDFYEVRNETITPHSICLGEADAIITHMPYRACLVLAADCNPILLYDDTKKVMAVIHAGRRGVFDGIMPQTLAKMTTLYGTKAADCLVYVGASIRMCCYEVGQEVQREAFELGFDKNVIKNNRLDLIACIKAQCENLGIKQEHIEINPHCSCCNDNLYSYRREGITGRFGLLAMLL